MILRPCARALSTARSVAAFQRHEFGPSDWMWFQSKSIVVQVAPDAATAA